MSYESVLTTIERFGKVESLVLYRSVNLVGTVQNSSINARLFVLEV